MMTYLTVFMTAVLMVGAVGLSGNMIPEAEAIKGKGIPSLGTGSASPICGLAMCSEYPGGKEAYQANWFKAYLRSSSVPSNTQMYSDGDSKGKNVPSARTVGSEYPAQLDVFIHKFELDKISAEEALDRIKEVHTAYVDARITTDIIKGVGEKLDLYNRGTLNAEDTIESVHLTAEPQNVVPEFIGAVDEHLHKFELDKVPAEDAMAGVIEVHEGFTSLYITSDLIDDIGTQISIYNSGNDSVEHVLHEIHEIIEEKETEMVVMNPVDGAMRVIELPSNHVDMPTGSGVIGCEVDDWCYMPADLTVHVGDTVTWVNSDTLPHTVTAGWPDSDSIGTDYPGGYGFDSDFMSDGETFEHTFEELGEYDYFCLLHPWMTGSVTVE